MAGEDRHHGRVDEMEQEVQCRGEMTGTQEQNNRRGGDRKTRITKTVDQWQLPTPSQSTSQALYRRIHFILASTMTHQDAERRGREKNILVL